MVNGYGKKDLIYCMIFSERPATAIDSELIRPEEKEFDNTNAASPPRQPAVVSLIGNHLCLTQANDAKEAHKLKEREK